MSRRAKIIIGSVVFLILASVAILFALSKTGQLSLFADIINPSPNQSTPKLLVKTYEPTGTGGKQVLSSGVFVLAHIKGTNAPGIGVISNGDGESRFESLGQGEYELYATGHSCPGGYYYDKESININSTPQSKEMYLTCNRKGYIYGGVAGRVYGKDVKGNLIKLSGKNITITYIENGDTRRKAAITDLNGYYRFEDIPVGDANLTIMSSPTDLYKGASVTVFIGDFVNITSKDIILELNTQLNYYSIQALVVNKSTQKPIQGVNVKLYRYVGNISGNEQIEKPYSEIKSTNTTNEKTSTNGKKYNVVFEDLPFYQIDYQYFIAINRKMEKGYLTNYSALITPTSTMSKHSDYVKIELDTLKSDKVIFAGVYGAKLDNKIAYIRNDHTFFLGFPGTGDYIGTSDKIIWQGFANYFYETKPQGEVIYNFFKPNNNDATEILYYALVKNPYDRDTVNSTVHVIQYDSKYKAYFVRYDEIFNASPLKINVANIRSNQPIQNARVVIEDRKCKFLLSMFSDNLGNAVFNNSKFLEYYLRVKNGECNELYVYSTAPGYYDDGQGRSGSSGNVTKVAPGFVLNLRLVPRQNPQTKITGRIINSTTQQLIQDDQTKIYSLPFFTIQPDANGTFSKTVNPGKYTVIATNPKYSSGELSMRIVDIRQDEEINIDLYLYPPSALLNSFQVQPQVLDRQSLKPIAGASVNVSTSSTIIYRQGTDYDGKTNLFLEKNKTYTIKVMSPNSNYCTAESEIDTSNQDTESLSFKKQFIFTICNGNQPNAAASFDIFTNNKGKVLPNTQIEIISNLPTGDVARYNATTDNSGKAHYSNNFTKNFSFTGYHSSVNNSLNNATINLGDSFTIIAKNSKFKKSREIKAIVGTISSDKFVIDFNETANEGTLVINIMDPVNRTTTTGDYVKRLKVYKTTGEEVDFSHNYDASEILGKSVVTITGLDPATYYAVIDNKQVGNYATIVKNQDAVIDIYYCSAQINGGFFYDDGTKTLVVRINDNLSELEMRNRYSFVLDDIKDFKNKYIPDKKLILFYNSNDLTADINSIDSGQCQVLTGGIEDILGVDIRGEIESRVRDKLRDLGQSTIEKGVSSITAAAMAKKVYSRTDVQFRSKLEAFLKYIKDPSKTTDEQRKVFSDIVKSASGNLYLSKIYDSPESLFANFYVAYHYNRPDLLSKIQSAPNRQAANMAKYLWQLFAEKIESTDYGNEKLVFDPVRGKNNIPEITNSNLTWDQIMSAQWTNPVYEKLSIWDKISFRFNSVVSPFFGKGIDKIKSAVNRLNDIFKKEKETVSITVILNDKDGKRIKTEGYIIQIGYKFAVTNSTGIADTYIVPTKGNDSYSIIKVVDSSGNNKTIISPNFVQANKNQIIQLRIQ